MQIIYRIVSYRKLTHVRSCDQALIERSSVLLAVELGAAGKCRRHELVDRVRRHAREDLLSTQQQVLRNDLVSTRRRRKPVVLTQPSTDRQTDRRALKVNSSLQGYLHLSLWLIGTVRAEPQSADKGMRSHATDLAVYAKSSK